LQCYQLDHYLTLSLPRQSMVQPQVVPVEQAVVLELVPVQVAMLELQPLKYQIALMNQSHLLRQI
jgi:hypothetical protein